MEAWGDWIRAALVICALAAMQWLNSNYVRKEIYDADRKEQIAQDQKLTETLGQEQTLLTKMDGSLTALKETILTQHQKELEDHENRLRDLEKRH